MVVWGHTRKKAKKQSGPELTRRAPAEMQSRRWENKAPTKKCKASEKRAIDDDKWPKGKAKQKVRKRSNNKEMQSRRKERKS